MTTSYNPQKPATRPGNAPVAPEPPTVADARATCRELLALLVEENNGLTKQDISLVEERIQHKRRLTLRLEQILIELKSSGSIYKADAPTRQQVNMLAEEVAEFQHLAHKNAMMLKAAHQLRADLIIAIRDTVDSNQPRVQTYGANGTMNAADNATRLVAKTI